MLCCAQTIMPWPGHVLRELKRRAVKRPQAWGSRSTPLRTIYGPFNLISRGLVLWCVASASPRQQGRRMTDEAGSGWQNGWAGLPRTRHNGNGAINLSSFPCQWSVKEWAAVGTGPSGPIWESHHPFHWGPNALLLLLLTGSLSSSGLPYPHLHPCCTRFCRGCVYLGPLRQ